MRTLSPAEYDALLAQSEILEQDGHGVKVFRQPDGSFFKTFWFRRAVSSRRLYPEDLRFTLHARSLRRRGIPTVEVLERVRIPHLKRTGVIYHPLPGRTLRQAAAAGQFDAALARRLGGFIAQLHRGGILFRSLHLGNVLLGPDGSLGLIDIASMQVRPWAAGRRARLRNFGHLLRYRQDWAVLSAAGFDALAGGYCDAAGDAGFRPRLEALFRRYAAA